MIILSVKLYSLVMSMIYESINQIWKKFSQWWIKIEEINIEGHAKSSLDLKMMILNIERTKPNVFEGGCLNFIQQLVKLKKLYN